jgi:hypothetical protein
VLVFAPVANSDVSPIAVLGVPPLGSPLSAAKVATAQKASYKPIKGDLIGKSFFGMNTKIPNIEVIRSVWRRVKKDIEVIRFAWRPRVKKDIKIRDLKPVKEVKGGGGLTGESKPITGGTGTADTTSTWRYVPKKRPNPKRCAQD